MSRKDRFYKRTRLYVLGRFRRDRVGFLLPYAVIEAIVKRLVGRARQIRRFRAVTDDDLAAKRVFIKRAMHKKNDRQTERDLALQRVELRFVKAVIRVIDPDEIHTVYLPACKADIVRKTRLNSR